MIIPPLTLDGRQFNGPIVELNKVMRVFDELTGAPKTISVVFEGQTNSDA